jgi:hypothetical protein
MRDTGIQKKYPAAELEPDDPRGEIAADEINTIVEFLEDTDPAGTAKELVDDLKEELGDFEADLVLHYNIAKNL